ncbi:MAG: YbhN family protein [Candidatus Hermodarchaeota archaeon]
MHDLIKRLIVSTLIGIIMIIIISFLVDLQIILDNILSLSLEIMIFVSIIYLCSLLLRSVRYWMLVNSLNGGIKMRTSIGVTFSAYFLSIFLPARIGDGVKIIHPKKKYTVSYTSTGFALILEKILDLYCISFIVFLVVSYIFMAQNIELPEVSMFFLEIVFFLEILAVFILIIVTIWGDLLFPLFSSLGRGGDFLILVQTNYKRSINTFIKNPSILCLSLFVTLIIWLIDSICLYFILLDILKVSDVFLLPIAVISALFGYLTFIFPISPGNIGSYEFAVALLFVSLTTVSPAPIIIAALIEHGLKTLVHLLFGAPSTFYYSENIMEIFRKNS